MHSRLQQLERQYAVTDRERLEAVLQSRQLQQSLQAAQQELLEQEQRAAQLSAETANASAQIAMLQSTVDRLRSADLEELVTSAHNCQIHFTLSTHCKQYFLDFLKGEINLFL